MSESYNQYGNSARQKDDLIGLFTKMVKRGVIPDMKPIAQIRSENFAQAIEDHCEGKQTIAADRLGYSTPSLVSRMVSGSKSIGSAAARKIENVFGLPEYWMDTDHERAPQPFDQNVISAPPDTRRIPVLSYVQAGQMTEMRSPFSTGDVFEYLMTDLDLSEYAFGLVIRGDSMTPEFNEGDRALFDPALQPRPGDFVVAKNGDEEATFKKYRPRGTSVTGQEVFELAPLNDDYPTLRSDTQQLTIIGVMVEHRRYRRK